MVGYRYEIFLLVFNSTSHHSFTALIVSIELSTPREIPYLPGSGSPPSPVKRHQVEPKFCKTLVNLWCCGAFHCGIFEQHHVVYIFSSCLVSFRFLFFFQTCIDDENNFHSHEFQVPEVIHSHTNAEFPEEEPNGYFSLTFREPCKFNFFH